MAAGGGSWREGRDCPVSHKLLVSPAGPSVQQAHPAWGQRAHGAGEGDPDPAAQEPAGGNERHLQLQEGGEREHRQAGPCFPYSLVIADGVSFGKQISLL